MAATQNTPSAPRPSAYATAGVDIDSKMAGIQSIKKMVAATATAGSVGGIGNFGGLFASPGKDHLLVASTDGVGARSVQFNADTTQLRRAIDDINAELAQRNGQDVRKPIYLV